MISETMVTKSDITKRQEQLLEELNKCDDELTGQELHRPVSYTHLTLPTKA